MDMHREKRIPRHIVFLDLEKMHDRLPRLVLWKAMREKGIPEHLIALVMDLYNEAIATIRTLHGLTNGINRIVGVH